MKQAWPMYLEEWGLSESKFDEPFYFSANRIKQSECQKNLKKSAAKEAKNLCYMTNRKEQPQCFHDKGIFLLPVKNGEYVIIKGNGFVDIPKIESKAIKFNSNLKNELETSFIGNSESQHIDYIYSTGLLESFIGEKLHLTMRGRKYSPKFSFKVGENNILVEKVQYETDSVYEGESTIVILEAKNSKTTNTIIRQLYYPLRAIMEKTKTKKNIRCIFFEKRKNIYNLWEFGFQDINQYNSIFLIKSLSYIYEKREATKNLEEKNEEKNEEKKIKEDRVSILERKVENLEYVINSMKKMFTNLE